MRQPWPATGVRIEKGKEKNVFPSGRVFISKRISKITWQLAVLQRCHDDVQELFFILMVDVAENLQSQFF